MSAPSHAPHRERNIEDQALEYADALIDITEALELPLCAVPAEIVVAVKALAGLKSEMLEALEMLMPQAPSRGMCDEYDRAMWDNAAAVIAKAKEEAQS